MKNNGVKFAGIMFVLFSFVKLISGITYIMEVKSLISLQFTSAISLLATNIFLPILAIIVAIIVFIYGRDRKKIAIFFAIYLLNTAILLYSNIVQCAVFWEELIRNDFENKLLIYNYVVNIIFGIVEFVSYVVAISGVMISAKKKVNYMCVIAAIMNAVASLKGIIMVLYYWFLHGAEISWLFVFIDFGFVLLFAVGVLVLGISLNAEIKNNAILQE